MKRAILAIESSCDETALALVSENGVIFSQELLSQIEIHRQYGGVVPEIASRNHFDVIADLGKRVMDYAGQHSIKICGVAATVAPGLVGPLLVGSNYGRGLAAGLNVKFTGVHHLRGHLASVLLSKTDSNVSLKEKSNEIFPAIVLLVSGGHSQVLQVNANLVAQKIIDTCDDAAGECFDKSAKLMDLPYPGGPEIENLALKILPDNLNQAQSLSQSLPRPKDKDGNFSFSGLKTAIRLKLENDSSLKQSPAFCWAIEDAICDTLKRGLKRALLNISTSSHSLVVCGGVAANKKIRAELELLAKNHNLNLHVPPLSLCTDNAAMIGAAAWVQAPETALDSVKARVGL